MKIVGKFYYKPLALGELEKIKPERVLAALQKEVLKAIRARIQLAAFSTEAKKTLSRSLKTKLGPKSLTLVTTHPAFFSLVKGRTRGQMTWLQKARSPIPIILDDGRVIFRAASAKSMQNGGWMHPGHKQTTIIEDARKEARAIVKKRMKKEIQRQLRAVLGKTK